MSKSIRKPDFVDIPQFMAEITTSDLEKQTSAILEFISGCYFDHIIVIGVLFCIRLQNFAKIGHPRQGNDVIDNFKIAAVRLRTC